MNFKKSIFLSLLAITFLPFSAFAEDTITMTSDSFPNKTYKVNEKGKTDETGLFVGGIAGEIINHALKAKSIPYTMLWYPWKRAQKTTLDNLNNSTFIIPLTRNKEREPQYQWVAHLYYVNTIFVTHKGKPKINNFEDAKNKQIGVMFGTSYEAQLKKSGIIASALPEDENNIRRLQIDKIDGWYTDVIQAYSLLDKLNLDRSQFEFGSSVDSEDNWIATGKSTPAQLVEKVKSAVKDFARTPEYKNILQKYLGE